MRLMCLVAVFIGPLVLIKWAPSCSVAAPHVQGNTRAGQA